MRKLCSPISEWLLPSSAMKRRLWPIGVAISYVALIASLGGLRADHILISMLVLLDSYNERSRLFLKLFFPFILTGVVYDFMRYFYWQGISGRIRVAEPYYRDLRWFGLPVTEGASTRRVTPNEFFNIHHWTILDLLCGFAYLVYIAEYLLAAGFLFLRGHWSALRMFAWCFFCVNLLGFITYFIYPAAPPWYIAQYGLGPALMDIHPHAAAAQRFDQLLGTHFFRFFYGHGIDVYGAYPSLHVTYPFLVAWTTFRLEDLRWFRVPAVLFFMLICFSAVYLQHHYVVDILIGILYAFLTLLGALAISRMRSPMRVARVKRVI